MELSQIMEHGRAFALVRHSHLEACDELHKVLVRCARCAQQRQPDGPVEPCVRQPERRLQARAKILDSDLRAHMRAQAIRLRRRVKARRSVDAIAVQQGHRWHLGFYRGAHQPFRLRCRIEKAEGAGCMQLNIVGSISHTALPIAIGCEANPLK